MIKLLSYIAIVLILLSSASAIGLSPAEKYLPYNTTKITLRLINNERKNTTVLIYSEGELSKYISIKNKTITFKKSEFIKKITIYLDLPKDLTPGTKEIKIKAIENKKDTGQITALAATITRLKILVPYKGSLIKGRMLFDRKTNTLSISLFNFGKEKADTVLNLYADEKKLKQEKFVLESQKQKDFLFHLKDFSLSYGDYSLIADIKYNKKKLKLNTSAVYGLPKIKIININFKNFEFNGLSKIEMEIESRWNKRFNLTSQIKIGKIISEKKTKEINPKKDNIDTIIDMKNISTGNHTAEIYLSYYNYTEKKDITLIINKDKAKFVGYEKKAKANYTAIIIAIILAILIETANIIRKKIKKR